MERQAINTRVEGSAADLVKTAMVIVKEQMMVAWPACRPLKWSQAREGKWPQKELKEDSSTSFMMSSFMM